MGSGSSKLKRKVADIEDELSTSAQVLIDREKELNGKTEELQASKQLEEGLTKAKEALRLQIQELSAEWELIEKEREKQISKLKSDLATRSRSAEEHQRTSQALLNERDNERTRAFKLEQTVKTLEEQLGALTKNTEEQRTQLEQEVNSQSASIERLRTDLSTLEKQNCALAEENQNMTKASALEVEVRLEQGQALEQTKDELGNLRIELEGLKARASDTDTQLLATKEELSASESSLKSLRKQFAEEESTRQALASSTTNPLEAELALTRKQFTASKEYVAVLEKELVSAKASLQHSETMRNNLQRGQNESITRSSSLHEAFTALKMELLDSQRQYKALEEECRSLRLAAHVGGGQPLLQANA